MNQGYPMQGGMGPQATSDPQEESMEQQPGYTDPNEAQEGEPDNTVERFLDSTNVAEDIDKDELVKIGSFVHEGYLYDKASRSEWEKQYEQWLALAIQIREEKSFPWTNASNVKFPLVSTAAMQFAARAYPTLIPSDGRVVKALVIGADPNQEKQKRADRVSKFMSFQVLNDMDNWEEDMDRLLFMLPIAGTAFKKTYHDHSTDKNCSVLVDPKNLVVNYWTKDLDKSERVTEVLWRSKRQIEENIRLGVYLEQDLPDPKIYDEAKDNSKMSMPTGKLDSTVPYMLLEQHTFYDLDEDGYPEPYVILIEEQSKKVLRITPRFAKDSIKAEGKKIQKIEPLNFYTKYEFIPNPDGGFYGIGFGYLLGPLNDSTNTLINQLIDAGTLNNLQSGFIGKGLRLKMGDAPFKPGEWRPVNATGSDLKQQIFPLPTKEPSPVLMKLLELLIQSTKELASVAEIFTGKMPGQNTPATTTMATVEQGMKVFTAIYKRIYRSLSKEFKKLYRLNFLYVEPGTETEILDEKIGPSDFNSKGYDICPAADPNASSQQEKLQKAQGLMELLPSGLLNPQEVIIRMLMAQEQPEPEKLMAKGPPPPDPKAQEMQMKMQMEQQKVQLQTQAQQQKMELEGRSEQQKLAMKGQEHALNMQSKLQIAQADAAAKIHNQKIFMADAQTKLAANQALQGQKIEHTKEINKLQQNNMKSGKPTPAPKSSSRK
jgi:chaperonin GroES